MNPQPSGMYVCITELTDESGSCVYNRTGIITQYSPVITGEINVGFLDDNNMNWSVILALRYVSGLKVVCDEAIDLGEYNIFDGLYTQAHLMCKLRDVVLQNSNNRTSLFHMYIC